jgi:hypothetical protein
MIVDPEDLWGRDRFLRRRLADGRTEERLFKAGEREPESEGWVFHPDDLDGSDAAPEPQEAADAAPEPQEAAPGAAVKIRRAR